MRLKVLGLQGSEDLKLVVNATRNMSLENTIATLETTKLTEAQMAQVLVSKGVTSEEAKQTAATIAQSRANATATGTTAGLTSATNGLKLSFKGLGAAIKANPIGLIISVATMAISVLSQLHSKIKQDAEEAKQEARNSISEFESIETELESTRSRIEELKSQDTLTLTEQSELNKLEDANTKLTYQYNIKKKIADLGRKELAEQASNELTKSTYWSSGTNFDAIDLTEYYFNKKKEAEKTYYDLMESGADEKSINYWKDVVDNYDNLIADNLSSIDEYYEDLLDSEGNALPGYEDLVRRVEDLFGLFDGSKDRTQAQLLYDNYINENGIPKTKEEYDTLVKSLLNAAKASDKFVGSQTDAKAAILDTLSEIPELSEFYNSTSSQSGKSFEENAINGLSQRNKVLRNYIDTIEYYEDSLRGIEESGIAPETTKFGNIDTNNRQVLEWTDKNLSKYENALKSWNQDVEEMRGTTSTVLGSSNEFDGVEIAFSPMLQTENGAVLLDKDTVYEYIWGLIDKAGEGWTNDDLFNLDSSGLEINGVKINNLLAAIGDSAIKTGEAMHYLGTDGALNSSYEEMEKIAKSLGITVEELMKKYDEFSSELENNRQKIIEYASALAESQSNIVPVLEKIESLSDGLDQLDKIYADIIKGEDFDFSSILNNDKFKESFSSLGDSYSDFIKTITENSSDVNACQDAFNNLVTAYIANSGALNGLTESTRDSTIAMLEQMGVANAAEIVDAQLVIQKERLKYSTDAYSDSTYNEILQMYNEAEVGSATQQALAELALAKISVNDARIDTSSDIDQVIALANAANASASSIIALKQAMSVLSSVESLTPGTAAYFHAIDSNEYAEAKKTVDAINNGTFNYDFKGLKASDFTADWVGGSSSSGAGGSGSSSGSSSDSTKVVDWIETAIDRIERRIDKFKNTISNTYKTLKKRFSASKDEISAITDEIELQKKAYDRYMAQANSVGLSSELAQKVRDGSIDISEYDSDTAELISDYQEWYEKALDCSDAIDELHESLASLYEEKFDAISTDFDNQLSLIEHKANTYSNKLSILEDNGYRSSYNLYQSLASVEQENIKNLTQKYSKLQNTLQQAVNSGEIEEYSEAWYEMKIEINEVNEAIQESTASVLEYKKALRDLKWEQFDDIQEGISNISTESEFLINLLGNSNLYDDNGQLTNEGLASMGLHGVSYNTYMAQADKYAAEIQRINEELADDPANAELIERKQELLELQQDSISAAEDEKQAIIDMVEEGIELELSALQDLIDAYTDALDSAKDLYDYQKKIVGYTDEISSLEKQLSAYENDTSEETKATVQKLKVDLEEARENLQDAEYERYISDQKKLLDDLYNEYETILNERLDNVDSLLTDMIAQINTNSGTICETIGKVANDVGYTISSAMSEIWSKPNDSDIVPTETSYGSGDVNKDGVITAADARLALQMAGGLIDKDYSADVNGDGEITASDARMILRAAAKLDKLPIDDNEEAITQVISMYGDNFSSLLTTTNLALSLIESDINDLYNYLTGDVNNDKKITADDARFVLRGSAGLESMTGMQQVLSDVNSDGIITAADARIILRRAAGLEGFASGGVVSDLKSIIKANGDDYLTINTLKKGEAVLTPKQTTDFSKLIDSLPQLNGIIDVSGKLSELRSIHNSGNSEITFGDTIIEIDHVQDYNDFITQLQKDKQFEKMVRSMSVDLLNGGSLLAKNKYRWN